MSAVSVVKRGLGREEEEEEEEGGLGEGSARAPGSGRVPARGRLETGERLRLQCELKVTLRSAPHNGPQKTPDKRGHLNAAQKGKLAAIPETGPWRPPTGEPWLGPPDHRRHADTEGMDAPGPLSLPELLLHPSIHSPTPQP